MTKLRWLLPEVVSAVQERLLAEFGGSAAVRDTGMLESLLARSGSSFGNESTSVCELAASYAFGIVRNHPFVDGNKRTGFAGAVLFLELNGRRFVATEADAVVQTLALAAGELDENGYAEWLATNSRPN